MGFPLHREHLVEGRMDVIRLSVVDFLFQIIDVRQQHLIHESVEYGFNPNRKEGCSWCSAFKVSIEYVEALGDGNKL